MMVYLRDDPDRAPRLGGLVRPAPPGGDCPPPAPPSFVERVALVVNLARVAVFGVVLAWFAAVLVGWAWRTLC